MSGKNSDMTRKKAFEIVWIGMNNTCNGSKETVRLCVCVCWTCVLKLLRMINVFKWQVIPF